MPATIRWNGNRFRLVAASLVFTSILQPQVRAMVAEEIVRALAPGGALLWYDFAVNNPKNPHVDKISRDQLRALSSQLRGWIRSITLAPPLARLVSPRSWLLATCREVVPLLRIHLLAVLVKPCSPGASAGEVDHVVES